MTYKTWSRTFVPIQIEHTHPHIDPDVPENHAWTIVEAEGKRYLMPGRHRVNRVGFAICKNEWDNADLTIKVPETKKENS
jgi:hypothetical protein